MADPATYRARQEVEEERKRDPIPKLRTLILESGAAAKEQLDAIDAEIRKEVDAAVKFAEESPEPSLDELWRDTYVENGEPDEKPRQRVRGVDVRWPQYPTGGELKVSWELEPRSQPAPSERRAEETSRAEEAR